jgi:hypothetical protein
MKRLLYAIPVSLVVYGGIVGPEVRAQRGGATPSRLSGSVRVTFSTRDVEVIREHYAPRYRNLPPGLQKKVARTGQLPPGWQKKFEPFPAALESRLVTLPRGYSRGVVDGHAFIFDDRTHVIIDATVLF